MELQYEPEIGLKENIKWIIKIGITIRQINITFEPFQYANAKVKL